MRGRLYRYKEKIVDGIDPADALVDGIREATLSYTEITKCRPNKVYVRPDEWPFEDRDMAVPGDYDIQVIVVKYTAPKHFILSHEDARKPRRVIGVERIPVL